MRQTPMRVILAMFWLLAPAAAAVAQFWPGYGHYGGYGAWGGYASALENSTTRYIAQSDRVMGERAAMQQTAAMQSGIRSTLATQAETRTQAQLSQQQSNRDWWFQVQEQQLAQRRAASAPMPVGMSPVAGFESAAPTATPHQAATDIVKWPNLLCDPRFAAQRAQVEAPYRREPKAAPTADDYQGMIDAAGQMKTTLGQMTAEVSAQDYLDAEKFLDRLAAEARGRLEKAAPAPAAR